MQKNNPFFDDLARIATSAGSTMLEWRKEVERMVQEQMEKLATKMQLVSREEFEAVRAMAQQARLENEALKKRLDALDGGKPASAAKPAKPASAAKKPSSSAKSTKTD